MFLVLKDQEAQPLQCEILTEIGMADGILLILLNDFLSIIRLISRSCIYNEFYLIFYFDKQVVPIRFSLTGTENIFLIPYYILFR